VPRPALRLAFALAIAAFLAGAAWHVAAILSPALAPTSPAWRHGLFVAVNLALAAGFARRPRWLVFPFAALVLQQVVSHGGDLVEAWRAEGRVDWPSAIVLVAMPALLALLVIDRRERAREER
jgi:hypothetical protein